MAKELEIIRLINTQLKATTLTDKRFQKGYFGEIAELIIRDEGENQVLIPCIVDNYGECTDVFIDDKFPFQNYYILRSFKSEDNAEMNFGNAGTVSEQMADFTMVVAGYRPTLLLTQLELIAAVSAGMISELTKAQITALGSNAIQSVNITPPEININKQEIFDANCGVKDLYLQPEYILFTVNFTIETTITASCLSVC